MPDEATRTLIRLGKANWLASVCELNLAYQGQYPLFEYEDAIHIMVYEAIGWFG